MTVPEPLATFLKAGFNVEIFWSGWPGLAEQNANSLPEEQQNCLLTQYAEAVVNTTISPAEYEALTRDDNYATPEALTEWLLELWPDVYALFHPGAAAPPPETIAGKKHG